MGPGLSVRMDASPPVLLRASRIDARVVGVAVDDLPLTILAPVDVGGADRHRLYGATGDRAAEAFEPERVRQIPADLDALDIDSEVAHVGEARRDPGIGLAQLLPAGLAHPDRT